MTTPFRNILPPETEPRRLEIVPSGHETFKIDLDRNRADMALTDERDAVAQSVFVALNTERYSTPIYPHAYGVQLFDLIGKHKGYVIPVLKKRIKTALMYDDRVTNVDSFLFEEVAPDTLLCSFVVSSVYGSVQIDGVEINV